jgi:hypothetical protein
VNLWARVVGQKDSVYLAIVGTGALVFVSAVALLLQWRAYRAYRQELPRAERTLEVLHERANEIKSFEDEVKGDALVLAEDQPAYFILQQAAGAKLGEVNAPMRTRAERGYEDREFTITPPDRDRYYNRQQLATFFWLIENSTSRMRVTQLKLNLFDKKKPWEEPQDLWTFGATFTSRSRKAKT